MRNGEYMMENFIHTNLHHISKVQRIVPESISDIE